MQLLKYRSSQIFSSTVGTSTPRCMMGYSLTFGCTLSPLKLQYRFARGSDNGNQFGGEFNPYKILGVTPQTPAKDIKKAYQRLALKYHPDNSETGDNKKFQAVHEAYSEVRDGKVWNGGFREGGSSTGGSGADRSGHSPQGDVNNKYRRQGGYYAYEEPGSTTENYFQDNRRMGTFVKLIMLYSFAFIVIRIVMFAIFPLKGQAPRHEASTQQGGLPQPQQELAGNSQHMPISLTNLAATYPLDAPVNIKDQQPLSTDFAQQSKQEQDRMSHGPQKIISGNMSNTLRSEDSTVGNDGSGTGRSVWRF